jgi:DNA-binding PadR family transcriptional regulator
VYRELSTMAEAGLVEAGEAGPRDRRPYAITDAGRTAFREWLAQPPGLEQIRFPLLLTLVFERHLPDEELRALTAWHRSAHQERLAGYLAQRDALGEDAAIVLDFGIRYEEAVLGWFDALPERLRPP